MASLLDYLNGLNPMYAGGLVPQYLQGENALQQALASKLFGLTGQEQEAQQGYELGLGDINAQQPRAMRDLLYRRAGMGGLRSGITVGQNADLSRQFDRARADLERQRNAAVNQVAAEKTNAYSEYGSGQSDLYTQMMQAGNQAISADAQQQAENKRLAAEQGYQDQILGLQKQILEQQAAAQTPAAATTPATTAPVMPSAPSQPNVKPKVPSRYRVIRS